MGSCPLSSSPAAWCGRNSSNPHPNPHANPNPNPNQVREEFFSAGTPLVCSRTGGLADRVVHYSEATRAGNGVFFEEHTHQART